MSDEKEPIALLPCPFCGGEAEINETHYSPATVRELRLKQSMFHIVVCMSCGIDNGRPDENGIIGYQSIPTAAQIWNRRA
jgi:hypothetical protein